jgi:hypothetical protein
MVKLSLGAYLANIIPAYNKNKFPKINGIAYFLPPFLTDISSLTFASMAGALPKGAPYNSPSI